MILQNHPWIDDVDEAMKLLEEEKAEQQANIEDLYFIGDDKNKNNNSVGNNTNNTAKEE